MINSEILNNRLKKRLSHNKKGSLSFLAVILFAQEPGNKKELRNPLSKPGSYPIKII